MDPPSDAAEDSDRRPSVSVVVFAREAAQSIRDTLASLGRQEGIEAAEVIVADASEDGTREIIEGEFPWVRHLRLEPCTMPEGKARAIRASRGGIVAILDAVDQAEPGWLQEIQDGFSQADDVVQALGGEVTSDGPASGANGPGYLFEYGAFAPPLAAGRTAGDLPGNNVAYRRRVFDETCADLLEAGFYKPLFHARIRQAGGQLHLHPGMRVRHRIRAGLAGFCARRFHYGRCFGAVRLRQVGSLRRALLLLFAPVAPVLLSVRHLLRAWRHPDQRILLTTALPGLWMVCVAWGVGEWLGAWFGEGRSARMVY